MDEAFCNAYRTTLVGSRMPISIMSPYYLDASADVNIRASHRRPVRDAIRKVLSRDPAGGASREPERDSPRAAPVSNR
jgi:hypothetical protein